MARYADESLYTEAEIALWGLLSRFQNQPFTTAKGLAFTYMLQGNEMFVNRKEKSITRASINKAYQKAIALNGLVTGPKKLGTFGASYLYPVFVQLGIINNIKK